MKSNMIISISEAGTPAARTFSFKIIAGGQVLAEQAISPVESQEVREISRQYSSLFERGCRADTARDYFDILGRGLFHLFFEDVWKEIEPKMAEASGLVVASQVPEVLQLPWELLQLKDDAAIGFSPDFGIRRLPKAADDLSAFSGTLPPGPLRALFMACEPLDYEQEERSILRAMEGLDIAFEICDAGGFDELVRRAESFHPHLIHLFGQGKMKDGKAHFSFQAVGGRPDLRSPDEMGSALAKSGVQCVIFGGCQTEGPSSLDLLCQGIAVHVPMAVAWNASADSIKTFYGALASRTLDDALGQARAEAYRSCSQEEKICALPVIYSATDQNRLFDPGIEAAIPARKREAQSPLLGMTEGYAEDFVDRRRDLQRLIPALREGTARAVVITGPDGAGKTALATRLGLRLASEGYSVMPIYSSQYNPPSAARLLEAAISALGCSGRREDALWLRDPGVSPGERLKSMLEMLERGRVLILLDSLDLDEKTGKINDPKLAEFYLHMLRQMDRSRAIITSKVLPADAMTLPRKAWEWPLLGLPEAAFIRHLLKDDNISAGYRRGEISYAKLQELHSSLGLPACLAQTHRGLRIAGDEISLCNEFLARLYGSLSPDAGMALSQAAVFGTAVNPAGLAAVADVPENVASAFAAEWQELSMAYRIDGLWAVPSSARSFLLGLLRQEQRRDAHRLAGDFLREIAGQGHANELGLSRLDCLMEARGQYMAAEDSEKARAVTESISGYLERRGYYSELIRLNEQLLRLERHTGPMNWIARAYMDQGRYAKAEEWYSQAVEAGPDAIACHGLGTAYFRQGKYDLARESFRKAADICRAGGDLAGEAAALHSLASIDMGQKRETEALEKLRRVTEIQEKIGDLQGEAATLHDMATVDLRQGNYESARQRLLKSLEILQRVGDKTGEASALFNLASLDMEKGDFELSQEEFRKSLALKREMGDRRSEAAILHNLGSIEAQAGDKEIARQSFIEALKIFHDLGDKTGEAGAFFQLGAIAVQQNRIPEGLRLMALSAVILRSISSEDVKNVEPVVERLASQLRYSQDQFLEMVREVVGAYRKDKGWGLVEAAAEK
jgi:tetratricopeptide (TPR) repeat protein